jgi:hypothetical protein
MKQKLMMLFGLRPFTEQPVQALDRLSETVPNFSYQIPEPEAKCMRPKERELVWSEMKLLEDACLGWKETVSDDRDKFTLNASHQSAYRLSKRPDARGFIRSSSKSLLFRDASDELRRLLTEPEDRSFISEKGVEFRWSDIDEAAIRLFFAHIKSLVNLTR